MNKPLLCLIAFSIAATALRAEPCAIFSRTESRPVSSRAAAPLDPVRARFFSAYARDRAGRTAYKSALPLINPPEWGRTVSAHTGGTVQFHARFASGFVCRVQLHDLLPNHPYILTLNGNPAKAGNSLLPTPVPGNETEKYYDFLDIKTDANGGYDDELGVFLARGAYEVRIYVKDTADFKIVLYRDFFPFTVD